MWEERSPGVGGGVWRWDCCALLVGNHRSGTPVTASA